jgi:hypothetical protein
MATLGSEKAHNAVFNAIKKGILEPITKNTKCVDCGAPAKHYDHRDYNKPLSVEAVCQKCNVKRGPGIPNLSANPPNPDSMKSVLINLTAPQVSALRSRAKKTGLSVAELVRRAVDEFLTRLKEEK